MTEKRIKLAKMNPEVVANEIGDFVIERTLMTNSTGCVIGLSGGVDSSTTAAIIKRAFDYYNANYDDKHLELVGYMLPSKINDPSDTKDGVRVAKHLGIRHYTISIEKNIEALKISNPEITDNKYDLGNAISRERGNVLLTKAATEKKLLTGTGNKDEDFCVGYYTMFGDGAVHMSPIGNLPKRLVREMAGYLGLPKDLVNRTPTAGLEPGQTDFGDLGYDYDVVELVIGGITQGIKPEELYNHSQIKPLVEKQITLLENPKFDSVEGVVNDIMRRHGIANGKATIIHPPIAPITLGYE